MLAPYADKFILTMFTEDMYARANGHEHFIPMKRAGFGKLFMDIFGGASNTIAIWLRARKIESELHQLSDHMLNDIGIERWNIHTVAQKWAHIEPVAANDDNQTTKTAA